MSLRAKLAGAGLVAMLIGAGLIFCSAAEAIDDCPSQPRVRVLASQTGKLESIGIDSRGRLFFTNSDAGSLYMLSRPGATPKLVADGIDAPGGIIFQRRSGNVLVGFGDGIAQAADGPLNPEAGLLKVNPRSGESTVHTEGLQMANGIARGPGGTIFASIDIGSGIDRIRRGEMPELNWANVLSANGIIADRAKRSLFVNQTFTAAAIQRVPFDRPSAARPYYTAPPADIAAGFDGLTRDAQDHLYVAANGAAQVWRVSGPRQACALADRGSFANGPSDLSFGRAKGAFDRDNLYVTTFGGELLELAGARG